MRYLVTILGNLAIFAGLGGIVYGTWGIYDQHRRITSAGPIAATILKSRIDKHSIDKFPAYTPVIEFEYEVARIKYKSEATMPTRILGRIEWAEGIRKQYPVGRKVQAHVVSGNPTDAFLIPEYGYEPYITPLVAFVISGMGLLCFLELKTNSDYPPQLAAGPEPIALVAKHGSSEMRWTQGILGAIFLVLGAICCGHYLWVSKPPFDPLFLAVAGAYHAGAVWFVFWWLFSRWREKGFDGTLIAFEDALPTIGNVVRLRLTQPIGFTGKVRALEMRLVLESRNKSFFNLEADKPDPVLFSQVETFCWNLPVKRNETLQRFGEYSLPPMLPPTTLPEDKSKLHYVWTLQLRGRANRLRKLERDYILNVAPLSDTYDWTEDTRDEENESLDTPPTA